MKSRKKKVGNLKKVRDTKETRGEDERGEKREKWKLRQ
jgi:hypothetical protein